MAVATVGKGRTETDYPWEAVAPHLLALAHNLMDEPALIWQEGETIRWEPLLAPNARGPARRIADAYAARFDVSPSVADRLIHRLFRGQPRWVREETYDRLLTLRRSL